MKGKTIGRGLGLVAALLAVSLTAMAVVAAAKDRNRDRIPDRWERKHGLSLKHNQARRDQDSDRLRNRGEFRAGMDPRDRDSDDDGVTDGDEGAGKIASFDPETGRLVINLFNSDTVSGTVTDETEIECESDDAVEPDDEGEHESDEHGDEGPEDDGDDSHEGDDEGPEDDGDDSDERSGEGESSGPGHAGEDDCDGEKCTVDDLTEGRVVREASLRATSEGLLYEEIELG